MAIIYVRNNNGDLGPASSGGGIDLAITGATVGQVIAVKSVDEIGTPIEFDAIDLIDNDVAGLDVIYDLAEAGYIDPIIDTDNSVFIDETGNIYIY